MLRLRRFNLAPVVLAALTRGPFYPVSDTGPAPPVEPPVITPPPPRVGGGRVGGPWRPTTLPRPRPALRFKHVSTGGVAVGGYGEIDFNGTNLTDPSPPVGSRAHARQIQADDEFLLFGLIE